jgi:hypothetical protein
MITELNREQCLMLRRPDGAPALLAYLNQTTYSRQLKSLIELSEKLRGVLAIYVTRDTGLKVSDSGADITGTPTYVLLCNGAEQGRLLGESDADRLQHFVGQYLGASALNRGQCLSGDTADGIACGCNNSGL